MKASETMLTGAVPHRAEMVRELADLGDPHTINHIVDYMSRAGWLARTDERYLRWCEWPGCLRSFDVRTGPSREIDGHPWIYVRNGGTVLLCPDHQGAGHRPQRFEWQPGDTTIGMSCECGARSDQMEPTTSERCQQWWREHIESLGARAQDGEQHD